MQIERVLLPSSSQPGCRTSAPQPPGCQGCGQTLSHIPPQPSSSCRTHCPAQMMARLNGSICSYHNDHDNNNNNDIDDNDNNNNNNNNKTMITKTIMIIIISTTTCISCQGLGVYLDHLALEGLLINSTLCLCLLLQPSSDWTLLMHSLVNY
jgi:hypothetical protein